MEITNTRKDWIVEKLGEFAFHEKGRKPKNQKYISDETFKYVYVDIEAFEKKVFKSYTDGIQCNFCSEQDFLMVWDGSRSGLVGKGIKGALGSTLVRINFPGIENDYAYFFLKSKYQQINTRAKGTGTPHVDPGLLWNYNFPIAPLPEQRAIVAKIEQLFSELDNGIRNFKTAQDQLKIYRQAVLKKAFEGELTKEWRAKQTNLPTAQELLQQIKDEREKHYQKQLIEWKQAVKDWEANRKLGKKPGRPKQLIELEQLSEGKLKELIKLPNGWNWCKLGDVTKCLDSLRIPINKDERKKRIGNIPYYGANGQVGLIDDYIFNDELVIVVEDETFTGRQIPFSYKIAGKCWVNNHAHVLKNEMHLDINFLNYSLMFYPFTPLTTGTTGRKKLTQLALNNAAYTFCSKEEQTLIVQEIDSRLSVCDKLEESIKESLLKAEALRQSILKQAFEGKLLSEAELANCRKEADWEPAEELLGRIKKEKSLVGKK